MAGGCHPNRATDQLLADAGFWIDSLERDKLPKAPPLVRPRDPRGRQATGQRVGSARLAAVLLNSGPLLPGHRATPT